MVALISRRIMLGGGVSGFLSSNLSPWSSLEDVVTLLCKHTPRQLRQAVRDSGGRFLYRGNDGEAPRICHPEPDLLKEETYDDPQAFVYFECLEGRLSGVPARPSTGHMATSVVEDAALWGEVVSIWPLGSKFSFVWPHDERTFVPDSTCPGSELVIDRDLSLALKQGREILFASWFDSKDVLPEGVSPTWISAFVAVPSRFDKEMLRLLSVRRFGL
jgi:hypothetical protein